MHQATTKKKIDYLSIFKFLVNIYPESVTHIDLYGNSVLHLGPHYTVLLNVCQSYPELLRHRNNAGRIPLHEIIIKYSQTPLHEIINTYVSSTLVEKVQIMCNTDPSICELKCQVPEGAGLDVESVGGYLPLHILNDCIDARSFLNDYIQCTKLLICCYPAAVNITGNDGMTPYALALHKDDAANPCLIRLLLKAYPLMNLNK